MRSWRQSALKTVLLSAAMGSVLIGCSGALLSLVRSPNLHFAGGDSETIGEFFFEGGLENEAGIATAAYLSDRAAFVSADSGLALTFERFSGPGPNGSDGSDDDILAGLNLGSEIVPGTVSAWVRPPEFSPDLNIFSAIILSDQARWQEDDVDFWDGILVLQYHVTLSRLDVRVFDVFMRARVPQSGAGGRWRHIGITLDRAGGVRLYLDGEAVAGMGLTVLPRSRTGEVFLAVEESVFFPSGSTDPGGEYDGFLLDNLRIYSEAFSPREVRELFELERAAFQ